MRYRAHPAGCALNALRQYRSPKRSRCVAVHGGAAPTGWPAQLEDTCQHADMCLALASYQADRVCRVQMLTGRWGGPKEVAIAATCTLAAPSWPCCKCSPLPAGAWPGMGRLCTVGTCTASCNDADAAGHTWPGHMWPAAPDRAFVSKGLRLLRTCPCLCSTSCIRRGTQPEVFLISMATQGAYSWIPRSCCAAAPGGHPNHGLWQPLRQPVPAPVCGLPGVRHYCRAAACPPGAFCFWLVRWEHLLWLACCTCSTGLDHKGCACVQGCMVVLITPPGMRRAVPAAHCHPACPGCQSLLAYRPGLDPGSSKPTCFSAPGGKAETSALDASELAT